MHGRCIGVWVVQRVVMMVMRMAGGHLRGWRCSEGEQGVGRRVVGSAGCGRTGAEHLIVRSAVDEIIANAKEISLREGDITPGAGEALNVVDVRLTDTHHQFGSVDALTTTATTTHTKESAEGENG